MIPDMIWRGYQKATLIGGFIGLLVVAGYILTSDHAGDSSAIVLASVIIGADVGLGGLIAFKSIGDLQLRRAQRQRFVLTVRALRRAFRKAKISSHAGIEPQLQAIESRWTEAHRAMQKLRAMTGEERERISLFDEGLALTVCHLNCMTTEAMEGGEAIERFHRLASAGEKLCRVTAHHFD